MLTYLSQFVASGTKTSTGFKQVHLNACAKALNKTMGTHYTGTHVGNHLRKWKMIYAKIEKLKNLSGALWVQETYTISLEKEHYIGHIQDHRDDAKYLNTLIEHYHEMATIFGNSLATSANAKGAYDPLATMVTETENAPKDTEDGTATTEQVGADDATTRESYGTKPPAPKKAKVANLEDPTMAMVAMLGDNLGNLATAITNMTKIITSDDDDIPEGLYEDLMSIPGFEAAHLDDYYAHLCEHPCEARQFYKLSTLSSKMIWVARYIKKYLSDGGL
ncbi:hypothetical protein GQ55_4G028200 [Panicum hallii var. hallii]|uniref:Uncharacterized protein n=1 Tax=Panicum hallii var. hallii TaxID=1504633 RepID=A0A2T7DUN5_9POAL|nr:hypothetical protein GQ55_4G028200 [Panicum hallii var. hallii]